MLCLISFPRSEVRESRSQRLNQYCLHWFEGCLSRSFTLWRLLFLVRGSSFGAHISQARDSGNPPGSMVTHVESYLIVVLQIFTGRLLLLRCILFPLRCCVITRSFSPPDWIRISSTSKILYWYVLLSRFTFICTSTFKKVSSIVSECTWVLRNLRGIKNSTYLHYPPAGVSLYIPIINTRCNTSTIFILCINMYILCKLFSTVYISR